MKSVKLVSINREAEKVGETSVGADFFGAEANPSLISQAVRILLGNQRKAYAKAKNRGQVNGSGVKIWNQKEPAGPDTATDKPRFLSAEARRMGQPGRKNITCSLTKK